MSTGTIEAVPVSELEALAGTPLSCYAVLFTGPCTAPAEFRLSARCACGAKGTVFLCPADMERARNEALHCNACYRTGWAWVLR